MTLRRTLVARIFWICPSGFDMLIAIDLILRIVDAVATVIRTAVGWKLKKTYYSRNNN
jgi:hypothetical protein